MRDLLDAMKHHMAAMIARIGQPRHGVVTSYDPARMMAKVSFHPGADESGWLPVKVQNAGNGWGIVSGLAVGQQVFVVPDSGDAEHGVVVGATFNDQAQPPSVRSAPGGGVTPVQSGETALVHASGQVIRLCKDGTIYSKGPWLHEGSFAVTGAITATGNVTAGQGGGDQVGLQTHQHPQSGGGNTSAPVAGT